MFTVEKLSPVIGDPDSQRTFQSFQRILLAILGGYGAVNATQALESFHSFTFDVGMSRAGVWLFIDIYSHQAPLFTLFLIGLAGMAASRKRGFIVSLLLPTLLLLSMGFALFGFHRSFVSFFNTAVPAGIFFGMIGWIVGNATDIIRSIVVTR